MPDEDDDALGNVLGERLGEEPDDAAEEIGHDGPKEERETAGVTSGDNSPDRPQSDPSGDEGAVRERSPFPLYVSEDVKEDVDRRYKQFNAERVLEDEPEVDKHKHFMEALLRAGLDHPDLEDHVLDEFES